MAALTALRNDAQEALAKAQQLAEAGDAAGYEAAFKDYETKKAAFQRAVKLNEESKLFDDDGPRDVADIRDHNDAQPNTTRVPSVPAAVANQNPKGYMQIAPGTYVPYATKQTEGFIRNSPAAVQLPHIMQRYEPGSDIWHEAMLQREAANIYLRKGKNALEFNEPKLRSALNALQEGTDSEGGYLVPIDQRVEIEHDPGFPGGTLRSISRVLQTSRDSGTIPSGTTVTWGKIGEEVSPTPSDPAFGQIPFTIRKSGANTLASVELLADSAANLPAFLGQIADESSGGYEDQQGVEGDGSTEPLGLRTTGAPQGNISDQNVTAAGLTLANMVDLWASLPAQFRKSPRARVFTTSTFFGKMAAISATGGQQWMLPNMNGPVPSLLGIPIVFYDGTGWDDAAALSATEEFGAIGDFNRYVFMDRIGLTVERFDERYADSDQVLFRMRKRYDSFFTLNNAFRIIKGA